MEAFHPAVRAWFGSAFAGPTAAQARAWPAIRAGRHCLIAAPTGSGKTLAAFLAGIDALVRRGLEEGLPDQVQLVYVSPLKALSNDIHRNLETPLAGIRDALLEHGLPDVDIRVQVRTGDTPQSDRERMRRRPPHILVTTPESLYILLTSESGRAMLAGARSLIVDEIHALAGNKRGAHLSLSVERLQALTGRSLQRVGLSATQKPIGTVARFLLGAREADCEIVDTGHDRERDLTLELPGAPLEAVMSAEVWAEVYDRLAELVAAHRTTLIFVNTRRLAERAARHLAERLGEAAVTAHHGSLAREHRLEAEQRLKGGRLRALVATASLELGIDIGDVDLVCQLGSPRAISAFLQRVGRSGHAVGATPKGRLFPLSRDDLVECTALLRAVRAGELDRLQIPVGPLDVLAQQIVAEVAAREWDEPALFDCLRRAWPYHDLERADFEAVLAMLAEGFTTRRGRRSAHLHRDRVNRRLRARRGARLIAMTNGGVIPDQFDYEVVLQPEGHFIGTLNEDFAFESLPGDIFQLGNQSYRMLKIERGRVYVEDAHGQPPNIPFWFGEAPGRTDELSAAVSQLRRDAEARLAEIGPDETAAWIATDAGIPGQAAVQLVGYLELAHAALGALPTDRTLVLERFFDEAGDQHLVIHSAFGSRINRAWGLALRKRFCRRFNFELQAAALEDSIVLSLGSTHSFALDEVARYLNAASVRDLLIQALLDAPMFPTRWRWCASVALAVRRMRNGRRVPAQFQRSDAEDLLALVFPDQLACLENISGDREVPDHPLVHQTLRDCLHELMDIDGLERVLRRLEAGEIGMVARDLAAPSPLAREILAARPYAFLDGAPAEERRTQLVQATEPVDVADAARLGRLDPGAIARARDEAWPQARDADELHDALLVLGAITAEEGARRSHWPSLLLALIAARRATVLDLPGGQRIWVAAERLAEWQVLHPQATMQPAIEAVGDAPDDADAAVVNLLRSRLEGLGPVTVEHLAADLAVDAAACRRALAVLQTEGYVLAGRFTPEATTEQWCERGLLARMHRYTLNRLRREIEPVAPAGFMRFLLHWHGLGPQGPAQEGPEALEAVLARLEGFEAPAVAWESALLPGRVRGYEPAWLDGLCTSGRIVWARRGGARGPVRSTPIALMPRRHAQEWRQPTADLELSGVARRLLEVFHAQGASFAEDLQLATNLLPVQIEQALGELVAAGLVSADSFAGLRGLLRPQRGGRRRGRRHVSPLEAAGRWALLPQPELCEGKARREQVAHITSALLRRYGVVFRALLARETGLPGWRELLYALRRMEARGEVRGGRFVQGFSGEQFALPEAVGALRRFREPGAEGALVVVNAADPLNLAGILFPGERVPALASNRLLYRDGVPVGARVGKHVRWYAPVAAEVQQALTAAVYPFPARARGAQ